MRSRALLFLLLLATAGFSQPVWQPGTRLAHAGGSAMLTAYQGSMTNATLDLDAGTAYFLTPRLALGGELSYEMSPYLKGLEGTARVSYLALGREDLKHSLLVGVHGTWEERRMQTVTGGSFARSYQAAGVHAQYTYWLTSSVGLYVWPHLNRTNAGPSGTWEWQLMLPLGVQWAWQRRR